MPKPDKQSRKRREYYKEEKKLCLIATEDSKGGAFAYFCALSESQLIREKFARLEICVIPSEGVKSAPEYILGNVLKKAKEVKIKDCLNKDGIFKNAVGDSIWIVCDTDRWKNIDSVIAECHQKKVNHAFSNPCFEIWLYLHQDNCQTLPDNSKKCKTAGNLLLTNNGTRKGYDAILAPDLMRIAIQHAKELDTEGSSYPAKIGTHIYKLVEYILPQEKP